jgi:hypothetical protein
LKTVSSGFTEIVNRTEDYRCNSVVDYAGGKRVAESNGCLKIKTDYNYSVWL